VLYDLHVHTTASDGVFSPRQIIDMAIQTGLEGIAITDHDTVDGLPLALSYVSENRLNIDLIPGIELNTEYQGNEIHILGYFIDHKNYHLNKRLNEIKKARHNRAIEMINKLCDMGFSITINRVAELARGGLIGRPHIAQALIEGGYAASVKEAFSEYIGPGKPAYVPRYKFLPQEAVNLIRNAGGIPVIAHPGLLKEPSWLKYAIDIGVEGIEAYYPEHTSEQTEEFLRIGRKKGLIITGGSDFHGLDNVGGESAGLGEVGITMDLVDNLYKHHTKKIKIMR
jgi:predicted metal-dependent phosphoesterase TrpH